MTRDLTPATVDRVIQGMVWALEQIGPTYLILVPHYEAAPMVPVLLRHGFFEKPMEMAPSNLVTATLELDLTQDLEQLQSQMRSNTRGHIRRGLKEGIEVTQGDVSHLDLFHQLMCSLCARRGTSPFPPRAEAFHDLWRCLSKSGTARLFLARYQSEVVSAAFTLVFANTMRVWKVGWSGEHDERRPNQVMWWEMIQFAKRNGCNRFDFMQLLPEHARAVLKGETMQDSYWGVTQFKLGFGGNILLLPEAYYRSFNPLAQTLLKAGGAKFLASPMGLRWVRKLSRSKVTRRDA